MWLLADSSDNSGRTYIQDILLDGNGHVTGITTATESVVNTDEFTTGATFNSSNGIITFTRNDGDTFTVDIDGRFLTSFTESDPIFTPCCVWNHFNQYIKLEYGIWMGRPFKRDI